jgi:hypothetical protein
MLPQCRCGDIYGKIVQNRMDVHFVTTGRALNIRYITATKLKT